MEGSDRPAYQIPRYRAPDDTAFYHFLHGTVPGHQIDFMICPEVPQGALQQTHFGHLTRLIRYIEPRQGATFGFALGNLSRDDVQHEPGHGGVAILFALRVPGVTDHAGRNMPPYAHGIVAVDRSLEYVQLVEAMIRLHRRFIEREDAEHRRGEFYRTYVRIMMQEAPEVAEAFLGNAITEIADIPRPPRSKLGFDFEIDPDAPPPARIHVVHEDSESFSTLAHYAALMGAALYRSNVKWTSITTGREIDIAGGTSVCFVPASEEHTVRGPVHRLDDLPEDEGELILRLFGARRRTPQVPAPRQGWREKLAAHRPGASRSERPPARTGAASDSQDSGDVDVEIDDAAATLVAGFEADGSAIPPPRRQSAPPPQGWSTPGVGFDPRRSSPVTGAQAAQTTAAAHFDPRRSSPVTGVQAVQADAGARFDPRRSSPVTGARAVSAASALPSQAPRSVRPFAPLGAELVELAPPHAPPPAIATSAPTHLERVSSPAARRGRWIIAAAAFAAVVVIVIVTVVAGISLQGAESGQDDGGAGAPE